MIMKTVRICNKCSGRGHIIHTFPARHGMIQRGIKCKKCKGSGRV